MAFECFNDRDDVKWSHPEIEEIYALDPEQVDQIRELVHDAELAPVRAPHKVYVLEQADRLQGAPANALLKTLEEPPQDVVCLMLATQESAVLETIRSRCEVLHLRARYPEQPSDEEAFNLLYALVTGASNQQVLDSAKRMCAR